MTCGYCGYQFRPQDAQRSCSGCPLVGNCGLVRCPRCGYEMPPEPVLFAGWRRLSGLLRKTPRSQDDGAK